MLTHKIHKSKISNFSHSKNEETSKFAKYFVLNVCQKSNYWKIHEIIAPFALSGRFPHFPHIFDEKENY